MSPATTLERIRPHFATFGITRCADITGLDSIGIPVYVAVRPQGRILQTANGKGVAHVDAQVSAYMEAIEQWHAENPCVPFVRTSFDALKLERRDVVEPEVVEGFLRGVDGRAERYDWVRGENLRTGTSTWLPAFAGYYYGREHQRLSYNGLASGNHIIEATLHAMYELVERDALATLSDGSEVAIHRCEVIELASIDDETAAPLCEQVQRAGLRLVLLRTPAKGSVHTFIAVLLDPRPFANASRVNIGSGAHLSPAVAATRAITEAAQSRLTFIHGSRDDLTEDAYDHPHDHAYDFFSSLDSDVSWLALDNASADDMSGDYERVLHELGRDDREVYRLDLSQGIEDISVVKVVVPGIRRPAWM